MHTIACSFTLRKNAKRAAETMISKATVSKAVSARAPHRRSITPLSPVTMGGLRSSGQPPRPRRLMKLKLRPSRLQRTSLQLPRRLRPAPQPAPAATTGAAPRPAHRVRRVDRHDLAVD